MENIQHKELSQGRWQEKPFLEQMANIGSEVYRAINWEEKNNKEYSEKAFIRSLELFDMSKSSKLTHSQFKELLRAREIWVDFFKYGNTFNSTGGGINDYFKYLTIASRN